MKKVVRLLGIFALLLTIGLSMTTCSKINSIIGSKTGGGGSIPRTSGRLTINKIPKSLNGKYVIAYGANPLLIACDGFSGGKANATVNLGRISGGSVTLKVWKTTKDNNLANYNGTDKGVTIIVGVSDKASMDNNTNQASMVGSFMRGGGGMLSGNFANGKATVDGSGIMTP